jgi:translocation and assembly module TamA
MAQSNHLPRARRWHWRMAARALCLLMAGTLAQAAGVKVEVHGVNDELRDNVLAYLSFQRYQKGGADLTADTVERLHNRVEREVDAALRPFGYYEPKVDSTVTQAGKDEWRVSIDITPGQPVLIDHVDVHVDGPGEKDPLFQRILTHLPMHSGDRLNHAAYDNLKADLQRTAATYGYLDAHMVRNELIVDPPNFKADIALSIDTGPRYRFGATTIDQHVVRESLVRRYLRYHEGDPFDLTEVLRTQFALDDAQYFTNLAVQPGTPDRKTLIVPVTIKADPSRRFRYSFGAGYATDTGVRGTLGFEDRHVNSLGHRFSVELQASEVLRYSLQSRYTIPVGDPAVENLALRATIEQRIYGDVTARTLSTGPSFTEVGGDWQRVYLLTAMRTTSYDLNGETTDRLIVPEIDVATVPKGYLGEPLFERPFFGELRGSDAALGSDSNFVQLHMQAERVFHLKPKWHLLLRDEVGATLVSRFSNLPTVFRFFAGGDNSVRGFGYQDLSPTDPVCAVGSNGKPILAANGSCQTVSEYIKVGGKNILTGTVEVIRDLPRNLGIATFVDYGNAFDSWSTPQIQYSFGVGLRVRLPVMTLGIDIAQPLSVHGAGPRLHINFSPKL